jgi:hypothetical protein
MAIQERITQVFANYDATIRPGQYELQSQCVFRTRIHTVQGHDSLCIGSSRCQVKVQSFNRLVAVHDLNFSILNDLPNLSREAQINWGLAFQRYEIRPRLPKVIFQVATASSKEG